MGATGVFQASHVVKMAGPCAHATYAMVETISRSKNARKIKRLQTGQKKTFGQQHTFTKCGHGEHSSRRVPQRRPSFSPTPPTTQAVSRKTVSASATSVKTTLTETRGKPRGALLLPSGSRGNFRRGTHTCVMVSLTEKNTTM